MRQFSDFFFHAFSAQGSLPAGGRMGAFASGTWQPAIDICECRGDMVIIVELPGVDKGDIQVTVESGVLKIAGSRPKRLPPGTDHVYQMEIPYGAFSREIELPEDLDLQMIEAECSDGYLNIRIPRITPDAR